MFSGISSFTAILSGREATSLTFDPTDSIQVGPPVDHQQEAPFLATVSCWGLWPRGKEKVTSLLTTPAPANCYSQQLNILHEKDKERHPTAGERGEL